MTGQTNVWDRMRAGTPVVDARPPIDPGLASPALDEPGAGPAEPLIPEPEGWTDPLTGREYVLLGRSTGTSFVDISNPEQPIYLGNLPTHSVASAWRAIKVYADHAYIVSEASGHGMQVFDLRQLRAVASPPVSTCWPSGAKATLVIGFECPLNTFNSRTGEEFFQRWATDLLDVKTRSAVGEKHARLPLHCNSLLPLVASQTIVVPPSSAEMANLPSREKSTVLIVCAWSLFSQIFEPFSRASA